MGGRRDLAQQRAERCREVVLVALSRGPMTTIELHTALQPEGLLYSDVYPALRVLEGRGLVERMPHPGQRRQPRSGIEWRRVAEAVVDLDALQDELATETCPTAREDDR